MTKFFIMHSLSLLLFYIFMYFQLDYTLAIIIQTSAITAILIIIFLLARSFVQDKRSEAEQILKDAKAEAEKMMNDVELNIKQKKEELINHRAMLNAEKQDLLKKEEAMDNKAEKWKQQLSQQSLKLSYYSDFISWCWQLIRNKSADDTYKIDSLKRKLHGLRR